jgi:hypothetical protein
MSGFFVALMSKTWACCVNFPHKATLFFVAGGQKNANMLDLVPKTI